MGAEMTQDEARSGCGRGVPLDPAAENRFCVDPINDEASGFHAWRVAKPLPEVLCQLVSAKPDDVQKFDGSASVRPMMM